MKRGPLGACKKTETRTEENDNDKAKKYFKGLWDVTFCLNLSQIAELSNLLNIIWYFLILYFQIQHTFLNKDPELAYKDKLKSLSKLQVSDPSSEGNELIEALKQRTIDNKDKNDLIVRQVTLQNDLVCDNYLY